MKGSNLTAHIASLLVELNNVTQLQMVVSQNRGTAVIQYELESKLLRGGLYKGTITGFTKGDTRSLDYSSKHYHPCWETTRWEFERSFTQRSFSNLPITPI